MGGNFAGIHQSVRSHGSRALTRRSSGRAGSAFLPGEHRCGAPLNLIVRQHVEHGAVVKCSEHWRRG